MDYQTGCDYDSGCTYESSQSSHSKKQKERAPGCCGSGCFNCPWGFKP